jgi:hypothetical protein
LCRSCFHLSEHQSQRSQHKPLWFHQYNHTHPTNMHTCKFCISMKLMNCYSELLQDITVVFVNISQIICTPHEHNTRWDSDASCDIWGSHSDLQGQAGLVFDTTDGGTILYLMTPMESLSKPPKWGWFLKLLPGVHYLLIPVAIPQLALKLSLCLVCFCFAENCFGRFSTSQIIFGTFCFSIICISLSSLHIIDYRPY